MVCVFSQRRRVLDENYYLSDVFVKSEKAIPYFFKAINEYLLKEEGTVLP